MMACEHAMRATNKIISVRWPQLAPTLALVRALLARHPSRVSSVPELSRSLDEAEALAASGPARPTFDGPKPELREGWPNDEDVARSKAMAAFEEDLASKLDLALCVLGTFVARCARDDLAPAQGDALEQAFTAALQAHRAHREEERAHAIAQAEAQGAHHRARQNELDLARWEARVRALKALSDEQLLCERESTHEPR